MLRIDLITIFPKMIEPLIAEGIVARGIKQGLLDIRVWDLRDFATDKHRSTDDEAYGGGPGMVMLAEPVLRAVEKITSEPSPPGGRGWPLSLSKGPGEGHGVNQNPGSLRDPHPPFGHLLPQAGEGPHLIMTSPQGRVFTQDVARELATKQHLVILCGRYEGFDERIRETLNPDEISIGDFVVSGGELPAMLIADATARMIEGVVGNTGSVLEDSFFNGLLDYPHYTRPEELRGMKVPDVLLSGHHENIRKWRKEQSLRRTLQSRPDLLENADLDDEARRILRKIENENR